MSDFIHIDMDAFFASVEQLDHPEWRGLPVIVGSPPTERGVVSTCSYEARKFGVHSAMPSRQAYECCPQGIFVLPRMERYHELSERVFAIFGDYTPYVEPVSVDEAFLDVSHAQKLFGSSIEIGHTIQERICTELGLSCSVGIAGNKSLAKLGSEERKPRGFFVVPPLDSPELYHWLGRKSAKELWGVGPALFKQLQHLGLDKVAAIQATSLADLAQMLGANLAAHLHALAFGRDERAIVLERTEQSFSREHTYLEDCTDLAQLQADLCHLVESVGRRLRRAGFWARTFRIKLRYTGFRTVTRQVTPGIAICDNFGLQAQARALLLSAREAGEAIRLIGFCVDNLTQEAQADDLFAASEGAERERREKLSHTLDELHSKFGRDCVHLGATQVAQSAPSEHED